VRNHFRVMCDRFCLARSGAFLAFNGIRIEVNAGRMVGNRNRGEEKPGVVSRPANRVGSKGRIANDNKDRPVVAERRVRVGSTRASVHRHFGQYADGRPG
jgi:hypothetical protein